MGNPLFDLTYGLFVLSVNVYKRDNACIINTAVQVSSDPQRISISVIKANHTADMLNYTDDFTISTISQKATFDLFKRFGFQSGRDVEKFDGFDGCVRTKNGAYAITEGTNSYISAHIEQRIDLGSHVLIIAKITDMQSLNDDPSATYAYYHSNIKPKPKTDASKAGKTVWRCKVCGYEYEGETLPDGFICPTCNHGAEDFEKVTL